MDIPPPSPGKIDQKILLAKGGERPIAALSARQTEEWHQKFPLVWTQKKTDCGKINVCVKIVAELVPPPKQYFYPKEAEAQLVQTIQELEQQGVI